MLYLYNGKIYVKLYENKIVEVEVTKNGEVYDAKPTTRFIEKDNLEEELTSISIDKAYEVTHKTVASRSKKDLEDNF